MTGVRLLGLAVIAGLLLPGALPAQKKKRDPNAFPPVIVKPKKEPREETQVLPAPKDPPGAVVGDSTRLFFLVSPLSGRGLLSQQTRDALKWLAQSSRGGTVLKVRAFVAGTGDVRRVQEIVSEVFSDRRQPMPALTVAQVGALPGEGTQVQIEATVSDRRTVNEHGLAFISAQPGTSQDPVGALQAAVRATNLDGSDVRRVTCYLSSLEHLDRTRQSTATAFPNAVASYIQVLRGALSEFANCEAVAALKRSPERRVTFVGGNDGSFALAALVGPGKLAISGSQLGFQTEEADLRLAFDRLAKTLETVGANYQQAVLLHIYTVLRSTGDKINALRSEYHGKDTTPAGSVLMFEALPGLDASFGIEVIAAL